VFSGKINRNYAMAILLFLSIFLFQLTAFVHSADGGNVSLQISITTFISLLFASLAAFAVDKYLALVVGGVNLIFFLTTITLVFQDRRMMDDLVFFSMIIVGYTIAMYYYRHSLEILADGLYRSYKTVKKTEARAGSPEETRTDQRGQPALRSLRPQYQRSGSRFQERYRLARFRPAAAAYETGEGPAGAGR
jgi:hypothetical protein